MAELQLVEKSVRRPFDPGKEELEKLDEQQVEQSLQRLAPKSDLVDLWRVEVDDSYTILRSLDKDEPEELFATLAGVAARVAEIRTQLTRMESRKSAHFRTQEVDPLLAACEFQFKCWSRLAAVRGMEQQLSGRSI